MFEMRVLAASDVADFYRRRVRQFLLVEQEVQQAYLLVKHRKKQLSLYEGSRLRLKLLAGRKGRFLAEGPELYLTVRGEESRLTGGTLTEVSTRLAPVVQAERAQGTC